MALRSIVVYDDPRLRKSSRRMNGVDEEVGQLIDDMIETMHEARGIGLAAIQIGIPQRLIIVHIPEPEDEEAEPVAGSGEIYAVLNPEVVDRSEETEEGIEGCLSVPGLVGEVERHSAVTIEGIDRHGESICIEAEGLLARVFQHEIDHCDGVLFIDHIDDLEKLWQVEEGEEEAAEMHQDKPPAV